MDNTVTVLSVGSCAKRLSDAELKWSSITWTVSVSPASTKPTDITRNETIITCTRPGRTGRSARKLAKRLALNNRHIFFMALLLKIKGQSNARVHVRYTEHHLLSFKTGLRRRDAYAPSRVLFLIRLPIDIQRAFPFPSQPPPSCFEVPSVHLA